VTGDVRDTDLLEIAQEAAAAAAAVLFEQRPTVLLTESKSSLVDIVTDMDKRSESIIRDVLARRRPHDAVLGEEGGATSGSSEVTWVVDPLDGTVNYLYDRSSWAVSIAAEVDGLTRVGVVAAPALGVTYWATRGGGSFADYRGTVQQLHANPVTDLAQSLIATGFGYRRGRRAMQARVLPQVLPNVRDIRRAGAAAIDLCAVAHGRVDGYFERGLAPWDVAAGALIAAEAGAVVRPRDDNYATDRMYFAAAPGIADALYELLMTADADGDDLADDVLS